MKKLTELQYHLLGWGIYALYLLAGQVFGIAHHSYFFFSITFVEIIEFYVCYLWVFPMFLRHRKIGLLITGLAVAMAVFIGLRYLVEEVLYLKFLGIHNYGEGTTASDYIIDNIYWGSSYIFISAAVFSTFEAIRRERENKSLREEKVRAELAFLKSQINPHFLYNTLNYIYSLAYPVSEKLADSIIRLSQLMRYMLNESADDKVDLQKEIDYIQNYIEVYRLRFEDNFFVTFDIEGEVAGKRLSALMLIPFVENAFKHGVVDDAQRPVKIKLKVIGNQLSFSVSNKINRNQKDHSSGIGLANIRRRLELLYPAQHELLISANSETYKTVLNINL